MPLLLEGSKGTRAAYTTNPSAVPEPAVPLLLEGSKEAQGDA